jgi:hypothetical protein
LKKVAVLAVLQRIDMVVLIRPPGSELSLSQRSDALAFQLERIRS